MNNSDRAKKMIKKYKKSRNRKAFYRNNRHLAIEICLYSGGPEDALRKFKKQSNKYYLYSINFNGHMVYSDYTLNKIYKKVTKMGKREYEKFVKNFYKRKGINQ